MEIMNFDDEIKQKIQEKFEKAIENQFEELGRSQNGVEGGLGSFNSENFQISQSHTGYGGNRNTNLPMIPASRNKLIAKCKDYREIFMSWEFRVGQRNENELKINEN